MRSKVLGSAIVLAWTLCLCGCAIRMTGPCLGYGCPMGSGGGSTNAMTAAPQPTNANAGSAAAQNGAAAAPNATPKKKHHRFLFVF